MNFSLNTVQSKITIQLLSSVFYAYVCSHVMHRGAALLSAQAGLPLGRCSCRKSGPSPISHFPNAEQCLVQEWPQGERETRYPWDAFHFGSQKEEGVFSGRGHTFWGERSCLCVCVRASVHAWMSVCVGGCVVMH